MIKHCLFAQKPVQLWKDTNEKNASSVLLVPYCSGNSDIAVIICPGGSYYWLDKKNESNNVAKWLNSNGISAFILQYRTAGYGYFITHRHLGKRDHHYPEMIRDAQRALYWVRTHADEYHVDPNKVGMLGFSAGGHLAMLTACYSNYDFSSDSYSAKGVTLRPDFVAAIYPVVTMSGPYVQIRSRTALLGEFDNLNESMCDSLSVEKHIPSNCPPVFLANCIDDPIVDFRNSEILDEALTKASIPHKYLQFKTGGHGFGVSDVKGTAESRLWKNEFISWLEALYEK